MNFPTRSFRVLALSLALPLAGCFETPLIPNAFAPSKEQIAARKQELAAKDDETCRSYGAKTGTDIYVQCRMAQEQRREGGDGGVTVVNTPAAGAVPASDAPHLQNIIPQTTRCQSVPVGGMVQTVCR
jgi:hypothetical protein